MLAVNVIYLRILLLLMLLLLISFISHNKSLLLLLLLCFTVLIGNVIEGQVVIAAGDGNPYSRYMSASYIIAGVIAT